MRRPGRFSLSPASLSSFTRQLDREVQLRLDMPLRVVRETHGLLNLSSSFGPSVLVSGSAYPLLHLSVLECLTSLADVRTYYALC